MRISTVFAACVVAAAAALSPAQQGPGDRNDLPAKGAADLAPTPIPGLTDKFERPAGPRIDYRLLGDAFQSQAAGLSFNPPLGCRRIEANEKMGSADYVVEYSDDDRQWLLKVTRATLAQKMPLQSTHAPGPNGGQVVQTLGLLDYMVSDTMKMHPLAEELRKEIVNVGDYGVGIAVLRFSLGTQRYLHQQAMFQLDEQHYYVFKLTSPAAKTGEAGADPNERLAVETFKAMVDTIQVLDRAWIREDQNQRLFRTRSLFLEWSTHEGKQIRAALVPQQWLRIVRNGRDIGYSYVAEEFSAGKDVKGNPARAVDGVVLSTRSRTFGDGKQIDTGSQMFVSLDRKHEDWAIVSNLIGDKQHANAEKRQNNEYGFSELKLTRRIDRDPRDPNDIRKATARDVESYKLSVSHPTLRDNLTKPEYHAPSVFYLPQALGAMLPRLLPLNRHATYMFQSYRSDERELINRYIDVGFAKPVQLDGQTVQAVPVSDRFRLDGIPTVHYMSLDGKYLGSVSQYKDEQGKDVTISVLPTTKAGLEKLWPEQKIWPFEADGPVVEPPPPGVGPAATSSTSTGTPAPGTLGGPSLGN